MRVLRDMLTLSSLEQCYVTANGSSIVNIMQSQHLQNIIF